MTETMRADDARDATRTARRSAKEADEDGAGENQENREPTRGTTNDARTVRKAPRSMVVREDASSEEDGADGAGGMGREEGMVGTTTRADASGTTARTAKGERRGVAFFDLDHTIIDVNSSWLWVKSEINSGRVGMSLIGTAVYWFSRYAFGYGDGAETAGRDAASIYRGEDERMFRERITEFFRMELAHRTRPGFKAVLEAHKANGERCVMCTSTWQHPAAIGAEIYGLETGEANVVSSIMGVDEDGLMDGTIQVVAYGDGKYETTKKWCELNGVDLKECYFYTDSMSDVKLLENVGYPVCVNADARLKKHAAERGWPTVDWGMSDSGMKKPRYGACLSCSA
jgi:HAD superfamily hydrolase (TIGR01490 family)